MSLYDDKSTVDDGEKPSANSNPQSPIDSSSPNQMKPRIKRKEKIPLTLKNLCCSENSFFFNLFWGIYLFLTQTLSLIVKNFISMVHSFSDLSRMKKKLKIIKTTCRPSIHSIHCLESFSQHS